MSLLDGTRLPCSARCPTVRWLVAVAAALGKTNEAPAIPARRGWGDSERRTPAGSHGRCASASTARWGSHRPRPLSATGPAASGSRPSGASAVVREPAWPPRQADRPRLRFDATARRRQSMSLLDGTRLPCSARCPTVRWLVAVAAPVSWQIHVVSCTIDRRFPYITFAKLNNLDQLGIGMHRPAIAKKKSNRPSTFELPKPKPWRGPEPEFMRVEWK